MKRRRNILEAMAVSVELPTEPIPGLPLVELAGERRVLIENHRGVMQYTDHEIRVKVSYGHICVSGSGLTLARMTKEQLVITGRINAVSLNRGRC